MRILTFLRRNLTWYWRTNLAVVWGVATAVGVLAGALLVGESVRASLRDLVLERLGNTNYVISSGDFFREQLGAAFPNASPLISLQGFVTHEPSGRRASGIQVYGVDERFWRFQNYAGQPPRARRILLSSALAEELATKPGDSILVRVEKPSAIPLESLHGRKEDVGRTLRFTAGKRASPEFSLRPQQGAIRAVFVPLARLQRDLEQQDRINTILTAGAESPEALLKQRYSLEDLGIKLRPLADQHVISLERSSALITDAIADRAFASAKQLGMTVVPILTYLANSIRVRQRQIPYSLVTAMNVAPAPQQPTAITLNEWAARDLAAKPGEAVSLKYYVWRGDGRLHTETAEFTLAQIVPIKGPAADRELTPDYPGITESESLHDWDPPFPVDLSRIRPRDEEYWKKYRTTPKAFISLARGQQLWETRFGKLTSIRIAPPPGIPLAQAANAYGKALRARLDPLRAGLAIFDAKSQGLAASRGATDFGEYFVYFSFFLMASALLLTGLFFKLGVEQRSHEIGVLRALGFNSSMIRQLFLAEGAVLAVAGAVAGIAAALAYAAFIMYGLRTWWVGAVGTRLLSLHPSPGELAIGACAGVITGLICIAWTVRGLRTVTARGLLSGSQTSTLSSSRKTRWIGAAAGFLGVGCLFAATANILNQTAGFFAAGTLLLITLLSLFWRWLDRTSAGVHGIPTLGFRNAAHKPGRSILCVALIGSATFIIVAMDAFRRNEHSPPASAYPLLAESVLPLIHDPNSDAGREALNLPKLPDVKFVPFRVKPGDDLSCLNLYQPRNPRVLAPPNDFLRSSHFGLRDWSILQSAANGAVPAIADANSLTYTLHKKVGDQIEVNGHHFRIGAALQDSIFQGELLISEHNFVRIFPEQEGYRFFLLSVPPQKADEVTRLLEDSLADYGFDVMPAEQRLAGFHRVENTYLSTFQTLGGMGLVLGTIGLAAVLLRNALERRRELALLRAVGYRRGHLGAMIIAENALLLVLGLLTGAACALIAIIPAFRSRGGHLSSVSIAGLLVAVLVTGLAASIAATAAALRSPLLPALRSE